jgi:hypothetical protein
MNDQTTRVGLDVGLGAGMWAEEREGEARE